MKLPYETTNSCRMNRVQLIVWWDLRLTHYLFPWEYLPAPLWENDGRFWEFPLNILVMNNDC